MAFPNPDVVYTDYNGSLYDLVANQIQEMELVRSKIFQLEQTHMQMKQKYVPVSTSCDWRQLNSHAGTKTTSLVCAATLRLVEAPASLRTPVLLSLLHPQSAMALPISSRVSWPALPLKVARVLPLLLKMAHLREFLPISKVPLD